MPICVLKQGGIPHLKLKPGFINEGMNNTGTFISMGGREYSNLYSDVNEFKKNFQKKNFQKPILILVILYLLTYFS